MAKCLFCTTPCIQNVVKTEVFITPEDHLGSAQPPSEEQPPHLQFEGDSVFTPQLKGLMILKNILKLPQETLSQFLQQYDGHFDFGGWMNLCSTCEESVTNFYQYLKEISTLEKKLAGIETELKWKIQSSKEAPVENPVGEQIRNAVIAGSQWITIDVPSGSEFEISLGVFPDEAAPEFIKEEVIEGATWEEHTEQSSSLFLDEIDVDEAPPLPSSSPAAAEVEEPLQIPQSFPPPPPPVFVKPRAPPARKASRVGELDESSSAPKKQKTSFTDGSKTRRYTCTQCPYDSTNLLRFQKHLKVHAPDSEAVICTECNWYILATSVSRHMAQAHPQLRRDRAKKKKPPSKGSKTSSATTTRRGGTPRSHPLSDTNIQD